MHTFRHIVYTHALRQILGHIMHLSDSAHCEQHRMALDPLKWIDMAWVFSLATESVISSYMGDGCFLQDFFPIVSYCTMSCLASSVTHALTAHIPPSAHCWTCIVFVARHRESIRIHKHHTAIAHATPLEQSCAAQLSRKMHVTDVHTAGTLEAQCHVPHRSVNYTHHQRTFICQIRSFYRSNPNEIQSRYLFCLHVRLNNFTGATQMKSRVGIFFGFDIFFSQNMINPTIRVKNIHTTQHHVTLPSPRFAQLQSECIVKDRECKNP